ncbi:MAG: hypothetical protein QFF03_07875 [Pseudomonadota bacterium]|nr:hypothetical protein [Pseudomonadota bacterium]
MSNLAPPPGAVLKDNGLVEFCADGAGCRTAKHPIAAGAVRQIVPGDFVRPAQASWIALSDRAVNLCYLAAGSASITCTPVANGVELTKNTQVAYVDLADGARTLKFTSKPDDKAAADTNFNPYPFMTGVSAAAEVLQQHAARHRGANAAYANTVSISSGDVCAFIDGGGITCTSTDGEAAHDGANGNATRAADATPLAAPNLAPNAAPIPPPDTNAIATVYTGKSERPTPEACTTAVIAQKKECNGPRNKMSNEARRTCVANAESTLQECMAEVRYNANLNR